MRPADGARGACHTARDRGDDMSRRKKKRDRTAAGAHHTSSGGGGVMRSIVRGFRTVARGGGSGSGKAVAVKKRTTWDVVTWVLLAGAVAFLIYKALT